MTGYRPYQLNTALGLLCALCLCSTAMAQTQSPAQDAVRPPSTHQQLQYSPLMKADIQALLPGQTIIGEYKFLRGDAQTYDFTERHFADGTTDYTDDKAKANGVWYTLGERKVCYRYLESKAMGTQISCFWIYQLEKCYYGYSAAQMTPYGPTNYDDWIARWIIKGTGGQCAAPTS